MATDMCEKGRLEGKVAVITGGGSGIGRGIALRLVKEGASVVVFDRVREGAEKVVGEIRALGRRAIAVIGDVTKSEDIEDMVNAAIKEFGRIDILINNAGGGEVQPFLDIREEDWNRIVDLNLKSVFLCTQRVAKEMIERGIKGRIVNISSYAGKCPVPGEPHYSAAKAGVIAFTQALAKELAKYGINVNAVCPGWTDTPGLRRWARIHLERFPGSARDVDELFEKLVRDHDIPLGRLGTPEDVAGVVAFLVSSDADYMTGQAINVMGGLEMR